MGADDGEGSGRLRRNGGVQRRRRDRGGAEEAAACGDSQPLCSGASAGRSPAGESASICVNLRFQAVAVPKPIG